MLARTCFALTLSALAFALTGCDDSDAASLRLRLTSPSSGEMAVSVLSSPEQATAAEGALSGAGVAWQARASVTLARGTFSDVGTLKFQEVAFARPIPGANRVEVTLPRGAGMKWPLLLAGATADERARAAAVMTPAGETTKLGKVVKFVVEVPGKVYNSSVSREMRGLKPDMDGATATLIVPVDTALQDGPEIRWTIEWDAK